MGLALKLTKKSTRLGFLFILIKITKSSRDIRDTKRGDWTNKDEGPSSLDKVFSDYFVSLVIIL